MALKSVVQFAVLAGAFTFAGLAHARAAAPYTVCTATINSSDEIEEFRRRLDPDKFNFVELTQYGGAAASERGGDAWFDNACKAKVQCDVLLVSGHYAGYFFGKSGLSLKTDDLEQKSCTHSCDGILRKPKEVFLMGCNTLASKKPDSRTLDEYQALLVGDGFDRRTAEQVLGARYTPWGPSFETRMRNIFKGVPRIYGFSSVSPLGRYSAPLFARYLDNVGDYAAHLDKLEAARDALERSGDKGARAADVINSILAKAMAPTAFRQTTGTGEDEAANTARDNMCAFYAPDTSDTDKLNDVKADLESAEWSDYLPVISDYLSNNEHLFVEPSFAPARAAIAGSARIKDRLDGLLPKLDGRPSLQIEALQLLYGFGWMQREDYARRVNGLLDSLLGDLTYPNAHLFCDYVSNSYTQMFKVDRRRITAADFKPEDLSSIDLARILPCIDTDDPAITAGLLKIDANKLTEVKRAWLIYALGFAPDMNEAVVDYVKRNAPHDARYRWVADAALMKKMTDAEAGAWIADALAEGRYEILPYWADRLTAEPAAGAAVTAPYLEFLRAQFGGLSPSDPDWARAARILSAVQPAQTGFFEDAAQILAVLPPTFRSAFYRNLRFNAGETPAPLVDLLISDLGDAAVEPHWPAFLLNAGPALERDQAKALLKVYRRLDGPLNSFRHDYIRGLIETKTDPAFVKRHRGVLREGPASLYACSFKGFDANCALKEL